MEEEEEYLRAIYGYHLQMIFARGPVRAIPWGFSGAVVRASAFTSEFVGLILATDSCEKSLSTLCRKSWVFFKRSGFLPQGKLKGWVIRINTVKKVISLLL